MTGFWEGGPNAFAGGLREDLDRETAILKKRLEAIQAPANRQRILDRIESLKTAYREEMRRIGHCLF